MALETYLRSKNLTKKCTFRIYYEAVDYYSNTFVAKIKADQSLQFNRKNNIIVSYTPADANVPYGSVDGIYDVGNTNEKLKLKKTYPR